MTEGFHLCMVVQAKWARCTNATQEEQTLEGSENEEMPQSANCLSLAQHQTGQSPLAWMSRKYCAFMQTFPGASWLDKK